MRRKPNTACKVCFKEIYRRPNQIDKGPVFCSIPCFNKRDKASEVECPVCGKLMPPNRMTCSKSCSNRNRTGIKYGAGQPKNNYSTSQKLKKRLVDLRGPMCQRCPYDRVEILEVHHIIERCNGGTDEDSNLELLCPNCHSLHHYLLRLQR